MDLTPRPLSEGEYVSRMMRSRRHALFMAGRMRREALAYEDQVERIDADLAPIIGPRAPEPPRDCASTGVNGRAAACDCGAPAGAPCQQHRGFGR